METATLFEQPMSNLAVSNSGNFVPDVIPPRAVSMLEVIGRAAQDPSVDVAKMQELLAMQKELMQIEAEQAFNTAMAQLQAGLPPITKHGRVSHGEGKASFKFAKYEHIDLAIRPLLEKYGFSFSFSQQGNIYFATISHAKGHKQTSQMQLAPDKSGGKNEIQATGSATSYARRYLVSMILNIVTLDEDDDAMGHSVIDGIQLQNITSLYESAKPFDEKVFMQLFNIEQLAHLQRKDYKNAVSMLKQKANSNKRKETTDAGAH